MLSESGTKKGWAVRILALICVSFLLLFAFISCKEEYDGRREYCEIEITLPEIFSDYDSEGAFDAAYTDGRLIVGIQRLSFDAGLKDGVPATMTPSVFAEYYLDRTETDAEILTHGYVPYACFSMETSSASYDYLLSFYRTDYAYFIITFIAASPMSDNNLDRIFGYVDTVKYNY